MLWYRLHCLNKRLILYIIVNYELTCSWSMTLKSMTRIIRILSHNRWKRLRTKLLKEKKVSSCLKIINRIVEIKSQTSAISQNFELLCKFPYSNALIDIFIFLFTHSFYKLCIEDDVTWAINNCCMSKNYIAILFSNSFKEVKFRFPNVSISN